MFACVVLFYKFILFILYGCEPWSLTLTEQRRLRLFENSVLRKEFGRKREDARRGDSRLPPRGKRDMHSFGILRSV